jgi:hypothetical protein
VLGQGGWRHLDEVLRTIYSITKLFQVLLNKHCSHYSVVFGCNKFVVKTNASFKIFCDNQLVVKVLTGEKYLD